MANAIEVVTRDTLKRVDWIHVIVSYDGSGRAAGLRVYSEGIQVPLEVVRDSLTGSIDNREPLRIGRRDSGLGFYGQLDEVRILRDATTAAEARQWFWSERLRGILLVPEDKRDPRQKKLLLDGHVARHGDSVTRAAGLLAEETRKHEAAYRAKLPKTLVMEEQSTPRTTHILDRGQYDVPGAEVQADVPSFLPPMAESAPRNRLGLAQWLMSPTHPLTARVAVNRLWMQCFGAGLVTTVDDLGSQGDVPKHAALLDWLAVEFIRNEWNVKGLLRLIVTSATYRQASIATPALLNRDPDNRLFARGARFRLPAEMVRDQALAVSDLLIQNVGGPPVHPYQPPGLWEAVSYDGEQTYRPDRGEGLWRRTIYSYWKRTAPPPGIQLLDGPTREICVVQRSRSNTPLQALLLLNDETYVEAARALAAAALEQRESRPEERVSVMFRRATARLPHADEITAMLGLYSRQRSRFSADRNAAERLLQIGVSPRGAGLDPVDLAAWTVVGQVILNLDEVITRR